MQSFGQGYQARLPSYESPFTDRSERYGNAYSRYIVGRIAAGFPTNARAFGKAEEEGEDDNK